MGESMTNNRKLEFDEKGSVVNAAWDELLKHESLNEETNEPDEQQAIQLEYFIEGASWQFNQCAQLLADKDAQIEKLAAENEKLTTKIAQNFVMRCPACGEETQGIPDDWNSYEGMRIERDSLKAKLAELEAKLEAATDPFCRACGRCGDDYCCPAKGCKYPADKANDAAKALADEAWGQVHALNEKIQALEAENADLEEQLKVQVKPCGHPRAWGFSSYCGLCERDALKTQVAELRGALEFYADINNYQTVVRHEHNLLAAVPLNYFKPAQEALNRETPKPDRRDEIIRRLRDGLKWAIDYLQQCYAKAKGPDGYMIEETRAVLAEIEKLEGGND